jgi:hypothetical protein
MCTVYTFVLLNIPDKMSYYAAFLAKNSKDLVRRTKKEVKMSLL